MTHRHVVALVVGALLAVPGTAAAATRSLPVGPESAKPYFDSRAGTTVAAARPTERTRQARAGLRRDLGRAGVLRIDPLTGTARQLLRTDGALSGPRGGARSDIAMDFVRANRAALGLDDGDLDGLELAHRATTPRGLTVLRFRQLYRGIPAFDNDLRVAIDRAGRVLSTAGAPRHDLSVASVAPSVSGAEALARLQRDVGAVRSLPVSSGPTGAQQMTRFAGGDFARLVLFGAAGGARLAWHVTYRATSTALYDAVVDASTGAILLRQNLTKAATDAEVYRNHPDAGATQPVDLEAYGLAPGSQVLSGTWARQWSDLNDNDAIDAPAEETPPSGASSFVYPFTAFNTPSAGCPAAEPCAWDRMAVPASWQANRKQNGVQAFYLASRFHDHLAGANVGFDDASGNFEVGGTGGDDPVLVQTDDGATTGTGGAQPNALHRNNANMTVPPDGDSPTMQMYLFRDSGSATADDYRSINGGDDSAIVWHEYTHGLSGRLVTNADGSSALSTPHAGAMGEGWSDWFASDLQVRDNLKTDTLGTPGEIDIGDYADRDPHKLRSQAADCPVGAVDAACPGGDQTSIGGYTLGDFGKIAGAPEVHADGEIWFETLWDLRQALEVKLGNVNNAASNVAESLIADGMRLSPPEPSMLDMRNAILAADQAAPSGGAFHDLVWDVFRKRGMGYFASANDGSDTQPVEDFTPPPNPQGPKGTATGIVTDSDSGLPIAGVRVGFGGHASQPNFADYLADQTDASGRYTIEDVPAGSYPKLSFFPAAGYDPEVVRNVAIAPDAATTHSVRMTRDWASVGGGAVLGPASDETGTPIGCGPGKAFDQSQGTTWSSFNPTSTDPENPHAGPPTVVVELPQTLDVTAFLIDPTSGCGNAGSASTREFTLETSTDGTTFRTAVDGTGANGFTDANIGLLNRRQPAGTSGQDVRFVRLRLISPLHEDPECLPQSCAGTDFIDITELKILGGNPNRLPTGSLAVSNAGPRIGQDVTFDAGSFSDTDSAITGYDWDFDGNGTVDRSTSTPTTAFAYGDSGSFNAKVAVKDFRGGAGTGRATLTVAPAAPGAPGAPGLPGAPGFPAALGPIPSLRVPSRGTAGAIRPSVRCALRCSVHAKLALSRAMAHRLGLKHRTIARLNRTLTTTERRRLRLRVPAKVRAAARRAGLKRLRATLTVTAKHTGGRTRTVRKAVRIKL